VAASSLDGSPFLAYSNRLNVINITVWLDNTSCTYAHTGAIIIWNPEMPNHGGSMRTPDDVPALIADVESRWPDLNMLDAGYARIYTPPTPESLLPGCAAP
jgi:hypothetical protein